MGINGATGKVVLQRIMPAPADPPSLASTTANCCASSLNIVFIAELMVNFIQWLRNEQWKIQNIDSQCDWRESPYQVSG